MKFSEIREKMKNSIQNDEGLQIGYISNIAMLLNDYYDIKDYETRNRAAKDILQLVLEVDCSELVNKWVDDYNKRYVDMTSKNIGRENKKIAINNVDRFELLDI